MRRDGEVVLPGEVVGTVAELPQSKSAGIHPSLGVLQNNDKFTAAKAGVFRLDSKSAPRIDTNQKRYLPILDDMVLGTVVERHTDAYKVDIGTSSPANLSVLAFEGATKRNKPNLQIGTLVYCRVSMANKDMDTEVSCISPTSSKEWTTGQSIFGDLKGGYVINCNLGLSQYLLRDENTILPTIGKYIPFEVAVGLNGKVWINAGSAAHTIAISNILLNSEYVSDIQSLVTTALSKVI